MRDSAPPNVPRGFSNHAYNLRPFFSESVSSFPKVLAVSPNTATAPAGSSLGVRWWTVRHISGDSPMGFLASVVRKDGSTVVRLPSFSLESGWSAQLIEDGEELALGPGWSLRLELDKAGSVTVDVVVTGIDFRFPSAPA